MKHVSIVAAPILLLSFMMPLDAAQPDLEAGIYIQDGTSPLTVDMYSAPCVVDWNNDGKKDLIVSQFNFGHVWLYLNQGTDSDPVFNGGSLINSTGSPITTTYG